MPRIGSAPDEHAPPLRRRADDRLQPFSDTERLLRAERLMLRVRWAALVFAFVQIFTYYRAYPPGIKPISIGFAVLLGVGNLALWLALRRPGPTVGLRALSLSSLALDVVVVMGFVFVYTFDRETAIWALIYILPLEGAVRFQLRGALWVMAAVTAVYVVREIYGAGAYDNDFLPTSISFRMGIGFIVAAVGGTMASNLVRDSIEIERHIDAYRESEERFRKVFESGPAAIVLVGLDGRILDANEAFYELLGCRAETLPDRALVSMIHPDDVRLDAEERRSLFSGEISSYAIEQRFVRSDGEALWMSVLMSVIRGRDGSPRYSIAMLDDITERRRAEESLREALRREHAAAENLRETDHFKSALLSAVSHDLRTPLTVVLGFAEQLERELENLSTAEARAMVERIMNGAQRLERLIVNLLDMDRLTRGLVRPKLTQADLPGICRRVLASLELPGRAVELQLHPAEGMLDVALVERILENLLVNVTRHTPPDSPVTIRTWTDNDRMLLAVEDRGPGVPDGIKSRIFEPFERGGAEHSPGTGVGLSLVKRFAELHGGRAWVEDRPGGGASFRVALPVEPIPRDGEPISPLR